MGSGGSQTLWSPSNEAGAYIGFIIDTVHSSFSLERMNDKQTLVYIWAGLTTATSTSACNAVVDGGALKRDQSN